MPVRNRMNFLGLHLFGQRIRMRGAVVRRWVLSRVRRLSTTSNAMGTRSEYAATARYSSEYDHCELLRWMRQQNAFLAQEVQAQD